jgi:predicted deacetylase
MPGAVAVALHDVEPRSFRRCREIRTWLAERGIERLTLLVIPAADLHPIGSRSPALSAWLRHRVALGDAVAQHGLAHRSTGRARWPASVVAHWLGGAAAEFPGLGLADTDRRVAAGLRFLREIELDPRGFVAPGYAYTHALREVAGEQFEWFADLRSVRSRGGRLRARALCLGASTPLKRALSPAIVRAAARSCGELMRIDVHPADFALPRHVATLEALLDRAGGREVVTYDELSG